MTVLRMVQAVCASVATPKAHSICWALLTVEREVRLGEVACCIAGTL